MIAYLMALVVVHSLAILPRAVAEPLARFYTRILDLVVPRLRRVGLRNLEMAMPDLDAAGRGRVIDGAFRSVARMLVAFSPLSAHQ